MVKLPTYDTLLSSKRFRPSKYPGRTLATETDSDYGRVLFSAALRRLQQKTQVFPLEDNAAVRSRLTHSFEVAYVGRLIALQIIEQAEQKGLSGQWGLSTREIPFRNTVETACLSHDIGNPPFGHFGEYAVRQWFAQNCIRILKKSIGKITKKDLSYFKSTLLPDFTNFDGNAQGFRILTRLQWNVDEFGLNLTVSQLAAFLKYIRAPHQSASTQKPFQKKAGFFISEEPLVEQIWTTLGLRKGQRHPLAYVMEASDDIAYCVSDIEDALEKELTNENDFKTELINIWEKVAKKHGLKDTSHVPDLLNKAWSETPAHPRNARFFAFKTSFTRNLTETAAKLYVDHHSSILKGEGPALLDRSKTHKAALDALKRYAQQHIFRSTDAEHVELAGFQVVKGLLEHLSPLLMLRRDTFNSVIAGERDPATDLERRLYNLLPGKHRRVYEDAVNRSLRSIDASPLVTEWFARAHLIVDFVSGMTDRYALETYQLLTGIRV